MVMRGRGDTMAGIVSILRPCRSIICVFVFAVGSREMRKLGRGRVAKKGRSEESVKWLWYERGLALVTRPRGLSPQVVAGVFKKKFRCWQSLAVDVVAAAESGAF